MLFSLQKVAKKAFRAGMN